MEFRRGTILKRKKSFEDDHKEYNVVRVIGQSPVVKAGSRNQEWEGERGLEVSIQPHEEFGAVIDVPAGELERDYEIVSVPEETDPQPEPKPKRKNAPAKSPEQQFAETIAASKGRSTVR